MTTTHSATPDHFIERATRLSSRVKTAETIRRDIYAMLDCNAGDMDAEERVAWETFHMVSEAVAKFYAAAYGYHIWKH